MRVTANGKQLSITPGASVSDLIDKLGLASRSVVVERNGTPVGRRCFGSVLLEEGDKLEVVRAVQGGSGDDSSRLREALEAARLYLVAPSAFSGRALAGALDAGVGIVQLRDKHLDAAGVIASCRLFAAETSRADVPLVVNDRPDIALAAGAGGVHLGQEDVPAEIARRILGPGSLIGRSTHSREQIESAVAEQRRGWVDYIAVGPVFHTPTHPERPAVGLELVAWARERVPFPWFAIGGIDTATIGDVVASGAERVVVVRAIVEAADPAAAARALLAAL